MRKNKGTTCAAVKIGCQAGRDCCLNLSKNFVGAEEEDRRAFEVAEQSRANFFGGDIFAAFQGSNYILEYKNYAGTNNKELTANIRRLNG